MESTNKINEVIEQEFVNESLQAPHSSRILIVEDDITYESIWSHIIERADQNAHFEWATSVPEAIQKIELAQIRGTNYDIVISDIFLSGSKTGIDLWSGYKNLLAGKIILVSGIDTAKMFRYIGDTFEAPLYLKKPLVINECIAAVSGILHPQTI